MKKTYTILSVLAVAVIAFSIYSCQKLNDPISSSDPNNPNGGKTGTLTGNIAGKVVTTNNTGVSGILVSSGSVLAFTNAKGEFYLPNVPAGSKVLVNFKSDNYSSTQKITEVKAGKSSWVDASVIAFGLNTTFNASTALNKTFQTANVTIPASAFVDTKGNVFSGTATIRANYFNPTDAQFLGCFPGDFVGTRTDKSETAIESFGFMAVDVYNGTEKLQLGNGKQATLTYPIPASLLAKAPVTIPLWHYDEVQGKWIEEGTATKIGNNYIAVVGHFSNWNCDMPTITSYIRGKVVDKDGNPVSYAKVHTKGVDYTGASNGYTDDKGEFKLAVKSNSSVQVWANYFIFNSQTETISSLPTPQIFDMTNNLIIPIDTTNICTITGRLIDNLSNPVTSSYIYVYSGDSLTKVLDTYTTNVDGRFKFFAQTGKSYRFLFNSYGWSDTSSFKVIRDTTCPNQATTVDFGDIKLDIGGAFIKGRCIDSNSKPVANVYISSGDVNAYPNGTSRSMISDSLGNFNISVRPNIKLKLSFYYKLYKSNMQLDVLTGDLGTTNNLGDIMLK
ncbi:MAG: carboxypeptidase-like regulatory domain-containing protein [Candidatus Kapabacteria bacterium]|nr:carboxypeptidase-like regulatory domain-containing protein [Candidatus Kapabacteria bacterium]